MIPIKEYKDNFSPNTSTLKIVADIGSSIPNVDAVPAGISRRAIVYKKYGRIHVNKPNPKESKITTVGFRWIESIIPNGFAVTKPTTVLNKKQ